MLHGKRLRELVIDSFHKIAFMCIFLRHGPNTNQDLHISTEMQNKQRLLEQVFIMLIEYLYYLVAVIYLK